MRNGEKNAEILDLITGAIKSLKSELNQDDKKLIMTVFEKIKYSENLPLENWDTQAVIKYEKTISSIAKEKNLTHLTDPYFEKIKEIRERD